MVPTWPMPVSITTFQRQESLIKARHTTGSLITCHQFTNCAYKKYFIDISNRISSRASPGTSPVDAGSFHMHISFPPKYTAVQVVGYFKGGRAIQEAGQEWRPCRFSPVYSSSVSRASRTGPRTDSGKTRPAGVACPVQRKILWNLPVP